MLVHSVSLPPSPPIDGLIPFSEKLFGNLFSSEIFVLSPIGPTHYVEIALSVGFVSPLCPFHSDPRPSQLLVSLNRNAFFSRPPQPEACLLIPKF